MPKFFVPPQQIYDSEILILGNDARHISSSLRMKVGETITICNMNKRDYECIISSIENGMVRAEIISNSPSTTEPEYYIKVYQCLPKGDKLESIVQKSVELGASSIIPVYSSFCVAKPSVKGRDNKDKKNERLSRIAYEAAEQCGRGIIPTVHECVNFERAVEIAKNDAISFICYENERKVSLKKYLSEKFGGELKNKNISFFIGPEGGFSKDEIGLAKENGVTPVGLGERILRTETASAYVLSALAYLSELR